MLSWKRILYVILIVIVVSCVFMIYNINEERARHIKITNVSNEEKEFIEDCRIDDMDKPKVRLVGKNKKKIYRDIYRNTKQIFKNLRYTVLEEDRLDTEELEDDDLVVFCDDSVSSYAELTELGEFVFRGGKVVLAAGLPEGSKDSYLWPLLGIREKSVRENYNKLEFEKPLMPVQADKMLYEGYSLSTWLSVDEDADVYIRDEDSGVPVLYTYNYGEGKICLINGTFLSDIRSAGLLTGAVGVLEEDFIYPVLGIKLVFLDNFPMLTFINDKLCMQMYGCSTESFVRDVVWPDFQGMCLRTQTPYTSSVLAVSSSDKNFPVINDSLFTTIGKAALQFDGELVYASNCKSGGKVCFNRDFIDEFKEVFVNYEIQGLVRQTDFFSEDMLNIPNAHIGTVRTKLEDKNAGFSCDKDYTEFPAATAGNSMEEGNLFSISSVLAAYGMVSHVFDINTLIAEDENTASWDIDKKQIGIFEKEVLACASWLEGKVLSQTAPAVRSYLNLEFTWKREKDRLEIDCGNMMVDQAFFFRTDDKIKEAEGLVYEEAGNGYYLLHVQQKHAVMIMEGD